MTRLQFGVPEPGETYRDRAAAFGIVEQGGRIAVAEITLSEAAPVQYDLPGGGVDPGETEAEALVREFGEEVGLLIRAGDLVLRASQYRHKLDGEPVNNHAAIFEGEIEQTAENLKIEDNHRLVWLTPEDFVLKARHEAQAWAVCVWMRRRAASGDESP